MTKLTPEQEMTEFRLKYPTPDREPSMINEELIAQARELCERIARNAGRQIALESSINALDEETYNYHLEIQRLATTHLAEMEEHHVGTNEGENHCWKDSGEYPCDFLVTKAKRLLGVE